MQVPYQEEENNLKPYALQLVVDETQGNLKNCYGEHWILVIKPI